MVKKKIKKEPVAVEADPKNVPVGFTPKAVLPKNSFVAVYQIEGRPGWRQCTFGTKEDFAKYLEAPAQKNHPKVVNLKWYEFDALTGTIKEIK